MPAKQATKPGAKKPAGKVAPKKAATKKVVAPKQDPLFEPRPRNFYVGGHAPPPADVTRFVRWPQYVWRQRRVRVLQRRLHCPPAVHQFNSTLSSDVRAQLFKLMKKYKPESKKARNERLKAVAAAKAKKSTTPAPARPVSLRCGLKCVTRLVEQKRARLVLIAHDVDPLELVLWLPTLCRTQGVPYAIVKGKAVLGQLTGFKQATVVAFDKIAPEDSGEFKRLVESVDAQFTSRYEDARKSWGKGTLSNRSRSKCVSSGSVDCLLCACLS